MDEAILDLTRGLGTSVGNSLSKLSFTPVLSDNPIGCYCLGRILMEKKRTNRENRILFILGIICQPKTIRDFGEVNFCGINIHPVIQVPLRLLTVFVLSFISVHLLSKIKKGE